MIRGYRPFMFGLLAAVVAVGTAWAGDWIIQKEKTGAAEMVLYGGKTGDVPFNHQRHQKDLECSACHGLFPQEAGVIEARKADGRLAKKKVMKQCQICHRRKARAGEPTGPVTCKKCHSIKRKK